ncbi:uncharacterized protein LOC129774247 [Toxorhynchites rutilus septentrionalis]|uniref:uncharacterized protein LOC129774247 n=1 Tax=Toxorhynchites rutilus septentrionalis TaxID=329112 RepID=UPI00247893F4|nr:uncharacterized protein LOC129774247 [Toxorhynchites rutilus septentrionalis]
MIRRSIYRISEFVENFESENDAGQVMVRLARLEELFVEYRNTILELLQLVPNARKENEKSLDEIEEIYYNCKTFLNANLPTQAASVQRINQPTTRINHIKYPELKLPDFSGRLEEWPSFRDSFDAAVHSCGQLNPIQKFQYLKGCLKGDASRVIDSITVTSENYALAWKTLINRYNNKKMLIKCHIKGIFDTPAMRRESSESLLVLVDSFERNISVLKRLGEPADRWSSILVYQLSLRLDNRTLREWENFSSQNTVREDGVVNDGMPSYVEMINFLQNHARVLQSLAPQIEPRDTSRPVESKNKSKPITYHVVESNLSASRKCQHCSQDHFLGNCGQFRKLTPRGRLEFAKSNRLCLNCLKTASHSCKVCPSSNCRECNRKHHTLLHLPPLERPHPLSQSSTYVSQQHQQSASSSQELSPNHLAIPDPRTSSLSPPMRSSLTDPNSFRSAHFANPASSDELTNNPPETLATQYCTNKDIVFLWIALVIFEDKNGNPFPARILLDCGSQCSFMSESLRRQLKLDTTISSMNIAGIGSSITKVEHSVVTVISSRTCASYRKKMSFFVLPSISSVMPSRVVDCSQWNLPTHATLADPTFNMPGPIDAILGN